MSKYFDTHCREHLHLVFKRNVSGVECVSDFAAVAREFTRDLGGASLCRELFPWLTRHARYGTRSEGRVRGNQFLTYFWQLRCAST